MGDILEINVDDFSIKEEFLVVLITHIHLAFYNENEYLMPEVASHSSQYIYPLNEEPSKKFKLRGLEDMRIVDATFIEYHGHWYLFFGEKFNSHNVLNLWFQILRLENLYLIQKHQ